MTTTPDTPRRVLVTGAAGALGGMVVAALERRDDVEEIVGVDIDEPRRAFERTEFVRADLRNPLVGRVVESSQVDTIVHLSTFTGPRAAGGRTRMKELNVIGGLQLFGAAQRAPRVRRVVVKSSTAVYGSGHRDPAIFSEDDDPTRVPRDGWEADVLEIEQYARTLGRRRPDIDLTLLRFANFLGGEVESAFAGFFALPVVPTVFGFDPRLQFCHEDDAVRAVTRATTGAHPGGFNVAGAGAVYLSQCVRLAGRVPAPLPVPLAAAVGNLISRSGRVDVTKEALRFLQFGRVVDTRRLQEEFGLVPEHSSRATFEDFARRRRITGMVDREEVGRWERDLSEFIARRGQQRYVAARRPGTESP